MPDFIVVLASWCFLSFLHNSLQAFSPVTYQGGNAVVLPAMAPELHLKHPVPSHIGASTG